MSDGTETIIDNPALYPDPTLIEETKEAVGHKCGVAVRMAVLYLLASTIRRN